MMILNYFDESNRPRPPSCLARSLPCSGLRNPGLENPGFLGADDGAAPVRGPELENPPSRGAKPEPLFSRGAKLCDSLEPDSLGPLSLEPLSLGPDREKPGFCPLEYPLLRGPELK